jgi:hypothetical protein
MLLVSKDLASSETNMDSDIGSDVGGQVGYIGEEDGACELLDAGQTRNQG